MSRCKFFVSEAGYSGPQRILREFSVSQRGWEEARRFVRPEGYGVEPRVIGMRCPDGAVVLGRCINEDECYLSSEGSSTTELAGARARRRRR